MSVIILFYFMRNIQNYFGRNKAFVLWLNNRKTEIIIFHFYGLIFFEIFFHFLLSLSYCSCQLVVVKVIVLKWFANLMECLLFTEKNIILMISATKVIVY